jgi:hypothetical protein
MKFLPEKNVLLLRQSLARIAFRDDNGPIEAGGNLDRNGRSGQA